MAKTNKIVYVTKAQYSSLITDGYITIGGVTYNYDANNTYMVREDGLEGTSVQSTGVTSGKVLTANGSGGATWETAGGGGGSGDVTASGTLSVGSVITGLGSKTVTALNGTNGKFLGWSGGATWKGLYIHTLYVYYSGDEAAGEMVFYFSVISTQSTAYTSLDDVPDGKYVASGDYNDIFNGDGHCRVVYFDSDNNLLGYWGTVNETMDSAGFMSLESATVTDTITQIA